MTRDEYIEKVHDIMANLQSRPEDRLIDCLAALDLIKIDEPKNPMDKLEDALRKRYFKDSDVINLKSVLLAHNLEVVEKTKR